jgi:hypothetical protein
LIIRISEDTRKVLACEFEITLRLRLLTELKGADRHSSIPTTNMKHKRHSQISHRGRPALPLRNLKDLPYVSSEESGLEGHRPVIPASQPQLSRLRAQDTSSKMRSLMIPKRSFSTFPPYIQILSIREWKGSSRRELVKGTIC